MALNPNLLQLRVGRDGFRNFRNQAAGAGLNRSLTKLKVDLLGFTE